MEIGTVRRYKEKETSISLYDNPGTGNILVIGDIILDHYCTGRVNRISPESPAPVFAWENDTYCLGGASNVASNIRALGWNVKLAGFIGKDKAGEEVIQLLSENQIEHSGLISTTRTIKKTRFISKSQQLLRVDYEEDAQHSSVHEDQILDWFRAEIDNDVKLVILSDYNKGVCYPNICRQVIEECRKRNIPIVVDPKGSNWIKYSGSTFITPNYQEFLEQTHKDQEEIYSRGQALRKKLKVQNLIITCAEDGVCLINDCGITNVPSYTKNAVNETGAGDTFVAALSVAIAEGKDINQAILIANTAAGLSVEKEGTSIVDRTELRITLKKIYSNEEEPNKVVDMVELKSLVDKWKGSNNKLIFTNGCFDLLHYGHIHLLKQAKRLGDKLIVGINSDESVRFLKGKNRPIIKETDRLQVIAAFDFVDCVILFNESTPKNLINQIKPDIIVKGGDYEKTSVVGNEMVEEVVIIPLVDQRSTSSIISNIVYKYSSEM